ncbi:MAG: phosphoglycerate dehydrogenase [Sporomusaceae bacterium]|nr:phosphoglycerate dehydrogenase [Sporomusaceae bacterium]
MSKKVLVAARSFARSPEAKAVLTQHGCELTLNPYDRPLTEAELLSLLPGMDALVAGNDAVTAAVIGAAVPGLKIIAKHGVGYDTIAVDRAAELGVPVTIAPGANSRSVADLTLALMLALARRIPQLDRLVRRNSWERLPGSELAGKTLGLIGVGSIGGEVARRARGFEMNCIAYDRCQRNDVCEQYGVRYVTLPKLLADSDYVSLHVPATAETAGMINRHTLGLMKPTAYLINTARGDLVVEEDLYYALAANRIAGAALDTFREEPLHDSRLFELDTVVLTPHTGAHTREATVRTGILAAEEVVRVLSGLQPRYAVNIQ